MTRDTAREMAVQLIFGLDHCDADREAFLDTFFSEEHFSSLKTENEELYIEYPSGKMLAYIQRIVFGVFDNLEEIDGLIQRYSSISWDIARISGTALAVLRVAVFEPDFCHGITRCLDNGEELGIRPGCLHGAVLVEDDVKRYVRRDEALRSYGLGQVI